MQILAALLHKHIKEIQLEEKNKRGKANKIFFEEKNILKTNYPSNIFLHGKSLQSCGSKLHG